ncbi:MAG TPA: methylmalonyl-CoA mutase family protein, partial [Thermoanaerobaculia bacterium]|nr:methylmalonyl-CoA mutase family protein [Thermoanaerobaculia bacterium]
FRRRREADSSRQQAHRDALAQLDAAARTDRNLLPLILDAIRKDATVGEISGTLKSTFGAHRDQVF